MRDSFADVFTAAAPRPELADRLVVFAPLVGSWDLVVEDVAADGTVDVDDGEWHFGWALDGRALADVWISPSRRARAQGARDGEWGLSLRFWDETLGAFRSTWIPVAGRGGRARCGLPGAAAVHRDPPRRGHPAPVGGQT